MVSNRPTSSSYPNTPLVSVPPSVENIDTGFSRNRVLLLLFSISAISAQNVVLSLGSGSGAPGTAVTLPITLTNLGGAQPASLQWSFSYPPGITGVTVTAGTAATSAQKLLACAGTTCAIYGVNQSSISSGLAATATFQLAPGASGAIPISLTNVIAASAAAGSIPAAGGSGTIVVSVAPSLSTVSCAVTSITTPGSTSCTVTLSAAAPVGGLQVSLSSTSASLAVPASVMVASGQTSATFSAIGASVNANQYHVAISASAEGVTRTTYLDLLAALQLQSLFCSPNTIESNATSTCTAVLSEAAVNPVQVYISSSNALLTVPAAVTIATGQETVSFSATAGTITTLSVANVSVVLDGQMLTAQVTLSSFKNAVQVRAIDCSPLNLPSLGVATCTVSLTSAAVSSMTLAVAVHNLAITAPSSVALAVGKTSVNFQIAAGIVTSPQIVILTVRLSNSDTAVATAVEVDPALVLFNPATYQPGQACSPGAIATVIGSGFTNQTPQVATGPFWPLQLAGVQLNVNDQPVPLFYASDTLIHFQCPALAPGTELKIIVRPDSAQPLDAISTVMQEATPGIYTLNEAHQGAVLIAGTDLVASADSIGRPSRPAKKGEYISIYADGLGPVNQVLLPGEPAPLDHLIWGTAPVTVVIGDSELALTPSFTGLTPGIVSLFVVNVQLTSDVQTGSSIPVYLKVTLSDGSVVSSNTVRIAVAARDD